MPEAEKLALREEKLLAEGHCEPVCVAHWLALGLVLSLLLQAPEGEAEGVPRWPSSAAAPPVALEQSVGEMLGEELAELEAVSKKEAVTCPPIGGSCLTSSRSSK